MMVLQVVCVCYCILGLVCECVCCVGDVCEFLGECCGVCGFGCEQVDVDVDDVCDYQCEWGGELLQWYGVVVVEVCECDGYGQYVDDQGVGCDVDQVYGVGQQYVICDVVDDGEFYQCDEIFVGQLCEQ